MQWQYKTVRIEFSGIINNRVDVLEMDAVLNRLGDEGWELVSTFMDVGELKKSGLVAMFKRPNPNQTIDLATRGVCPQCGYDLRGAAHEVCPECGWSMGVVDQTSR